MKIPEPTPNFRGVLSVVSTATDPDAGPTLKAPRGS